MASISKDKGRFRVKIRKQGHAPISKNFSTLRAAKRWAREMETALDTGDIVSFTNKTMADLVNRYTIEYPDIDNHDIAVLHKWKELLGGIRLREVRKAHVIEARKKLQVEVSVRGPNKGQPLRPSTINRRVAVLSRVCKIGIEEYDWLRDNPCHITRLSENNERNRLLSNPERLVLYTKLREHHEPALLGFVLVAEATGMRASEIQRMRWEHVDLATGLVEITQSKNNEKRAVMITGEALDWLKAWKKSQGLRFKGVVFGNTATGRTPFYYRPHWDEVKKIAGVNDLRFHDLRHGFITEALKAGMNPVMVQLVSGHKSAQMLKRYAHLVTDVAVEIGRAVNNARVYSGAKK